MIMFVCLNNYNGIALSIKDILDLCFLFVGLLQSIESLDLSLLQDVEHSDENYRKEWELKHELELSRRRGFF